jgi:diguanylate cyclase (GGDEF)-like protein
MTTGATAASESAVARPALEALLDAVAGVLAAGSLEDTLRRIADRLGALVRFDDLAVYEIDPDAQEFQPVFAVGQWAAEVMAERIPLGAGVTGWVVRNRRSRNVPDSSRDPLVEVVAGTDDDPESFVSTPLLVGARVVGALNVYRRSIEEPFDVAEVELVERFAAMAALAYDAARQRDALRRLADTDGLTGLVNHRGCQERLTQELRAAVATGRPLSVVVLDLDHFKQINDRFGHAEGDRVLRATAGALTASVRQGDIVGRLGGEEFLLLFPGLAGDLAFAAAERARNAVAQVVSGGAPLRCSAGIAAYPDDADTATGLLERADGALYVAKRGGRNQSRRFVTGPETLDCPSVRKAQVERMLDSDAPVLRPVFQPVVEVATGRVAGFEALARFRCEPLQSPDRWFAEAHRLGLGTELEARAVVAALELRPPGEAFLSINVSPLALRSDAVQAALPEDLSGVIIELTEHDHFVPDARFDACVSALRARGARIALDDAGAGYAGLQQLIRLAPDLLKLDRSLVHGVHADPSRLALLEALVAFALATGVAVCAEGVEDLADLRVLADLDVTYAQGYGLAKPGPAWPTVPAEVAASVSAEVSAGVRVAGGPRTATGAWARDVADLADQLATVTVPGQLAAAGERAARILHADHVAISARDGGAMRLLTAPDPMTPDARWQLDAFPATGAVLAAGVPGQVILGDPAADPDEVADLRRWGMAALLMVPITVAGEQHGLLELYRRRPQAFSAAEVDRARLVALQFAPLLERLSQRP